jgi:hypothetical protein
MDKAPRSSKLHTGGLRAPSTGTSGSLIVTEGHSDVFQGQPTGSVPLELAYPLQVWLIQSQAAQLAPHGVSVCDGVNLSVSEI